MKETNKLVDIEDDFPYNDILYLSPPISSKHPKMSIDARAGQFAPFAALSGFDEKIKEVQRSTSNSIYLDEAYQESLDQLLSILRESSVPIFIRVVYFKKDLKKSGGAYLTKEGFLKRVDEVEKVFVFQDKFKIPVQDIVKIEILDVSSIQYLI